MWPRFSCGHNLRGDKRTCRRAPDQESAVVLPVLGRTTCHSVLSADVCFHSALDRLGGKLDDFQLCPSLISSHGAETNWSYFCRCTSGVCCPAMVTLERTRCGSCSRGSRGALHVCSHCKPHAPPAPPDPHPGKRAPSLCHPRVPERAFHCWPLQPALALHLTRRKY